MPSHERPDAASIDADFMHLARLWDKTLTHWKELDTYYWRTFEVWDKKVKRPAYRPSHPTNIVDHAVNTMLAYQPKVSVYPLKPGVHIHEERADLKEKFLQAVLEETALQSAVLVWKQAGKHLIHYGYGVIKGPCLDFDALPELPSHPTPEEQAIYESEKDNWNPFRLEAIHPAQVKMDPREKQPPCAIERYQLYARDLEALTKKKHRQGKTEYEWQVRDNPYQLEEVTEWWSPDWHAMTSKAAGLLFVERNTWGFVPYAHAFAGHGLETTDRLNFDPVWWAKGILTPVLDSLKAEAQQASSRHNAVIQRAWARMAARGADSSEIAEALAEDGVLPFAPEEVGWIQYPSLDASMFQVAQQLSADIEEGTYARVLAGENPVGVDRVGSLAMLTSAAHRMFEAPSEQLEQLATVTTSRILRLMDTVEELADGLTIQGNRLTREAIEHSYACRVTFEVVDPVLQLQERTLGLQEVEAGLKSKETYRSTDLRMEDESGEQERLDRQRMREHPYYIVSRMKQVALADGEIELAQEFENDLKQLRQQLLQGNVTGAESPQENGQGQEPMMQMTPGGVPSSAPIQSNTLAAAAQSQRTVQRAVRQPYGPGVGVPKPAPRRGRY